MPILWLSLPTHLEQDDLFVGSSDRPGGDETRKPRSDDDSVVHVRDLRLVSNCKLQDRIDCLGSSLILRRHGEEESLICDL